MPYLENDTHMALLHSELHGWDAPPLPCCECGKDSEAYASLGHEPTGNDTQWLCKACCDADDEAAGNDETVSEVIASCPWCRATGEIHAAPCPRCDATGYVDEKTLTDEEKQDGPLGMPMNSTINRPKGWPWTR